MWIKRILILLPIIIFAVLLQSFFWVPTYDEQVKGNLHRLEEFITASTGDAKILNPILNADSASSEIVGQTFEGLIDRDENLKFRGRLATSWEIYEEAYFYINPNALIKGRRLQPEAIRELILSNKSALPNIKTIEIIDSETNTKDINISGPDENKDGIPDPITISTEFQYPARLKITLAAVDQELFLKLERILGSEYFNSFPASDFIKIQTPGHEDKLTALAETFSVTEHNPVIIFHLRKGVKFHDGHEFDATDVQFTYQAIMEPKNLSPRVPDYEPVKTLEVLDKYTVKVVYKRLYSPAFGTWGMGILPEHLLNAAALKKEAEAKGIDLEKFSMRDADFNRAPVGTGPFTFRVWKSDQHIILDRNEDYWEGPPHYKSYTYRVIPNILTQEMEFYGGAIDDYGVQPHQVARLKDDPKYQNFSSLSFGYSYVGYNIRREPFNDKRVRQALGMAIDTDKIIRYVMYEQAERITGPFVKQTEYYNKSIQPLPYDPEGALKLLKEAGWEKNKNGILEKDGKPFAFTLITNNGNPIRKNILTIAQDAWKKIGIDVKTDLVEWAVFIGKYVNKGNFDALILGWSMGIDPDLYQIWHSSQTNENQLNFVGFINEEADDLIVKIRQEYDFDKQVQYSHRLHSIIAEEQPYTFLFVSKSTAVLDKKIVIKEFSDSGDEKIKKITPTKTGSYRYYFNKWIKLPNNPEFVTE